MNSATVQDQIYYLSNAPSAIVEKLPSEPELFQWLLIQQENKTRPYYIKTDFNGSSSLTFYIHSQSLSEAEQLEIIKNAQSSIRSDTKDLDPEMRNIISQKFEDLLWK